MKLVVEVIEGLLTTAERVDSVIDYNQSTSKNNFDLRKCYFYQLFPFLVL